MIPAIPLTEPVTPARINLSVKKTKYPAATAAAIGNPTSATSLKKSIDSLPVFVLYLLNIDMRSQQDKTWMENNLSTPYSIPDFLSKDEIQTLIKFFNNSNDKVHKTTGPITLDVTQEQLQEEPFLSIINNLHTVLGDFKVFSALFFYTERPHIIHNDDSFTYPRCYKGINIPLEFTGDTVSIPCLCFFDQYYLEGPAKFFNGDQDIKGFYNSHVYEYSQVSNLSSAPFNEHFRQEFIPHIKPQWLQGLSIHRVLPWKPGDVSIFDTVRLHCASNFRIQGIKSKLALSIFTEN